MENKVCISLYEDASLSGFACFEFMIFFGSYWKAVNGVSSAAVGLHCIGPVDKSHNLFDPGMICGSHVSFIVCIKVQHQVP